MGNEYFNEALAAIESAHLSAQLYRTARRLLDAAGDNGQCKLSRSAVMAMCDTVAEGTMRRHLGELAAAGIIHYSTNEAVHVSFVAFPCADGARTGRAPTRVRCASTRVPCTENESDNLTNADEMITARASTRAARAPTRVPCTLPHTREVSLLVSYTDPTDQELTNKPAAPEPPEPNPPAPQIPPDEQKRSVALLTDADVGVSRRQAQEFAARHRFDVLAAQVFSYRRELTRGEVGSLGALIYRINQEYGASVVEADRATALWKRHIRVDDAVDERRRKYIPDEYAGVIIG